MNEYSPFNPILLRLFNVSNTFHNSIWVIYTVWHICLLQCILRNYQETYLKR